MSWFPLSEYQSGADQLVLRFVPDIFMPEHAAPVPEVTIDGPTDAARAMMSIDRFRNDFIVSLDIGALEVRVLDEMDCEETIITGINVSSRNVP